MSKRKQKISIGIVFAVLGLGLTLAFIIPARYLVVVLSLSLIISGIALCKSC